MKNISKDIQYFFYRPMFTLFYKHRQFMYILEFIISIISVIFITLNQSPASYILIAFPIIFIVINVADYILFRNAFNKIYKRTSLHYLRFFGANRNVLDNSEYKAFSYNAKLSDMHEDHLVLVHVIAHFGFGNSDPSIIRSYYQKKPSSML